MTEQQVPQPGEVAPGFTDRAGHRRQPDVAQERRLANALHLGPGECRDTILHLHVFTGLSKVTGVANGQAKGTAAE